MTRWLTFLFRKENNKEFVFSWQQFWILLGVNCFFLPNHRSWNELKNLIKVIDPNLNPNYEFGFYSSHSVCIPAFFPNKENGESWEYSLFIILLNFFAFIFIALGYGLMFRWALNLCQDSNFFNSQNLSQRNYKNEAHGWFDIRRREKKRK